MRKSSLVKLVLVNSLLAITGCARPENEEKKDEDDPPGTRTTRHYGHGTGVWYHSVGGGARSAPRTGSGVQRGGFGASGRAGS
jgi:hypothetical protein